MTSWHMVIGRDGVPTGKLAKCRTDPCRLEGHGDDIHADDITSAYKALESRIAHTEHRQGRKRMKSKHNQRGIRIPFQLKRSTLRSGLASRGIDAQPYGNQLSKLVVEFPGIKDCPKEVRTQLDKIVQSVNIIGYSRENGYESVIVTLPRKAEKTICNGEGPSERGRGFIILSMDTGIKMEGYRMPVEYIPIDRQLTASPMKTVQDGKTKKLEQEKYMIPRYGGKPITRRHFNGTVNDVSNIVTDDDWAHLNQISEHINNIISSPSASRQNPVGVRNRILQYLNSDNENARRFREYCGHDVDMNDVADMLVSNVSAMTHRLPYRGHSVRRSVLSGTSNDMNKKRYIASVMYFAGRCCYCGVPLRKGNAGAQSNDTATGEHLDPLDGMPPGETKFGNMALCCYRCNSDKGNKPLDEWIGTTKLLSDAQRQTARETIHSFRELSMYEPMSMSKARFINDRIDWINSMRNSKVPSSTIRRTIDKVIMQFQDMPAFTVDDLSG